MVGALVMVLAAACAPRYRDTSPPLPEDTLRFQTSYHKTFDRIVRTLQDDGYAIIVADRDLGVIETRPRLLKGDESQGGQFDYRTFLSIRVGGGWSDSWAIVHVLLVPGYPKERERVLQELQEGAKRP